LIVIKKAPLLKKIVTLIVLTLSVLFILFLIIKNQQNQSVKDSKADAVTYSKVAMTDFYWWYPWYGMYYKDGNNGFVSPQNLSGFVSQQAFAYPFDHPIPYLQSEERPNGAINDRAGIDWFKGNFSRAANSGINVITPMSRPDLKKWKYALGLMLTALKELSNEGKAFPKLMFHWDGVEYWVSQASGDLTGPGINFDTIWNGVKDTYDTVFNNLSPAEITKYLFTYPDGNTFPSLTYRIEEGSHPFKTSNWWVTQLKLNFEATYSGKHMYLILDSYWCNENYGYNTVIHTASCNADNYYKWGGALRGAGSPGYGKDPGILTVGPGFYRYQYDGDTRVADRNNGQWLTSQFNASTSLGSWIILETFNFGEEGSAIDSTTSFGNQYLDLTKKLVNAWNPILSCTSYTYSTWGTCINSSQTRTVTSSLPSGCSAGNTELLTQSCTMPIPACTSYTYSSWSTCINSTQIRTIISSLPTGCTTGNTEPLTQSCNVPTTPIITVNVNVICQDGNGPTYNINGANVSVQNGVVNNKVTDVNGNASFQIQNNNIAVRLGDLGLGFIPQTNQPNLLLNNKNSAINCSNGNITKCSGGIPGNPGNFCSTNNVSYEYCNLINVPNPGQFTFKLSNCGTLPTNSSSSSNTICGPLDTNNDGKIDIIDFAHFAKVYGKACSDNASTYTNKCGATDSNNDGKVDIVDFSNLAKKYNKSC